MSQPTKRVYARKDQEILRAAEDLFMRNGYAATSMNAVAAHAEVAKQTLYSNFPSKEALFAAVIDRRSAPELAVPSDVDLETGDLERTLVELAFAFMTYIYSPEQIELFQTVVAASRQFPELGVLMVQGPFSQTPAAIARFLRSRIARGELEILDASSGTAMFISLLKGDAQVKLLFNQPVDVSPAAVRSMAERGVHLFLRGAIRSS